MKEFDEVAYPFEGGENNGHQPHSGMTLRDHFAGLAMQAYITHLGSLGTHASGHIGEAAEESYSIADAMLRERAK